MYFCGPTVYARAHIGNARPFVIGMWLRRWLARAATTPTLVHNITDVNDKIYDAAPGASAELAERATAWYLEDTGDFGLGMPDSPAEGRPITIPRIVHVHRELIERGYAYAVDGDVYFRVARVADYGQLSGQRPDQVEEQEPNAAARRIRATSRSGRRRSPARTRPGSRRGAAAGRAGTSSARRWPRSCSAPRFEIHGGGLDLVFPHHENELAQSRALGHAFADIWVHNGLLRSAARRCRSRSGNVATIREALDGWGRETLLVFFLSGHWRKPIDFSDETMDAGARRPRASATSSAAPSASRRRVGAFAAALDDDFNTPEALALIHDWRDHDLLRRGLAIFGLESLGERDDAPSEDRCARGAAAARPRRTATSRRPTGCAGGSTRPAGRCGTRPRGYPLVRR